MISLTVASELRPVGAFLAISKLASLQLPRKADHSDATGFDISPDFDKIPNQNLNFSPMIHQLLLWQTRCFKYLSQC
jgi:hypothetical protein